MIPTLKAINGRTTGFVRGVFARVDRERQTLLAEVLQVRGLMPLLMKPRNKLPWTAEDKAELAVHLKRLTRLSPYLVVVIMPGGFFLLPVLAWWLDRRRNRSSVSTAP